MGAIFVSTNRPLLTPRPTHDSFTFLGCLGLALLGCYPCCIIPFCIPDCKTAVHVCPRCRNVIAVA